MRQLASKGLTECWREAMAAKPPDWRLMGVACGPREVDPNIHSAEEWCAWARGPERARLEGRGTGPQDTLLELTMKLRELSSKGWGDTMADLDFSTEVLLEQARGNETAFWHLALLWARQRDGSADGWAEFVGEQFAPSWDELGDRASAREVARLAGLNVATTADMRPVALTGDDSRAELLIEGPEDHWLSQFGTTQEESDRANELIFRAIAKRRGLTLEMQRDERGLHLVFARA